jgi:polysaccharide export outer membrane protein
MSLKIGFGLESAAYARALVREHVAGACARRIRSRAASLQQQPRRAIAIVAMVALLSGCGLSPGMSLSAATGYAASQQGAVDYTRTSGSAHASTDAHGAVGLDAPPAGSMIEITRELVEKDRAARPKGIPGDVAQLFGKPVPYTLGPGDILSIVVWDHTELNLPASGGGGADSSGANSVAAGYTVDADGMIQYAYIGAVKVAGLTEMSTRDLITQKLSRYIRQPQVTLRIQTYRSKRVYIDGEVRTPGVAVLNDMPMTLPEGINRSGGFTDKADRSKVAITRGNTTIVVNIPDMIKKGANPDNIILHDGDLVRVYAQTDTKVYVLGEVQRPGSLTFNNGRMSLNEALGDAGGISQISGDASQVFVVRGRDTGKPMIFHLDAGSPAAMATADAFELDPNDVVFVDASALVKWSRVIGLILPATQAAAAGRAIGY